MWRKTEVKIPRKNYNHEAQPPPPPPPNAQKYEEQITTKSTHMNWEMHK